MSSETVAEHEWYQVALPWSMTWKKESESHSYEFSVDLYVNGVQVGKTATWRSTSSDEIELATMVIGLTVALNAQAAITATVTAVTKA